MTSKPRKRFGQHFLHDKHVISRIVDNINVKSGCTLVEIGPGRGALTLPLLTQVNHLHVIEIDNDLADKLEKNCAENEQLILHRGDALKFDFCTRIPGKLVIIGNLPYNISTPLLFHLLHHVLCIEHMVFMLQKEVADRICAEPGSRDYGRLSIMVQSQCHTEQLFDVDPGSFSPAPRVKSSVIRLTPASNPELKINDWKLFGDIVRTAFSKRRKTIRNALKNFLDEKEIVAAGIISSSRPEQLSVETYIRLANRLHHNQ